MEQTMYEDGDNVRTNSTPLKPSFILDFNQQSRSRPQMDLGLLKLASPDLEKYLIQQEGSVVTAVTPTTQILFPKCVTQEQENYARGFIDALDELHRRQGIPSHVIKKEKSDDGVFYNGDANNGANAKGVNNQHGNYHSNLHSHGNNTYSESLSEISRTNGFFFINNNNSNNIINNNFIIVNNTNLSPSTSSCNINTSIPPLSTFNNNNNTATSQYSSITSLPSLASGNLNYNITNNVSTHGNTNTNTNTNNNVLLTNPDINLNQNIFSKNISPSLSPYPILPPAQTLLTRSPNTKQFQQGQQLDSKNFLPAHEASKVSLYHKNPLKRTSDVAKFNLTKNFSNLSPSSFATSATTTAADEHTNQTVPHCIISSPPSISSTGDSPASNSPCEEIDRLEIKRARNRLAAQKCRSRKLERIVVLSQRVEELKQQNASLEAMRAGVVTSIEQLRLQLQQHSHCSSLSWSGSGGGGCGGGSGGGSGSGGGGGVKVKEDL